MIPTSMEPQTHCACGASIRACKLPGTDPPEYRTRCRKCGAQARSVEMFPDAPRTPVEWTRRARAARYGLSREDVDAMREAQGAVCAVCGGEPPPGKDLVIDHCHETGHVRALLCSPCNCALGFAHDDPAVLQALAEYVRHHQSLHL